MKKHKKNHKCWQENQWKKKSEKGKRYKAWQRLCILYIKNKIAFEGGYMWGTRKKVQWRTDKL